MSSFVDFFLLIAAYSIGYESKQNTEYESIFFAFYNVRR